MIEFNQREAFSKTSRSASSIHNSPLEDAITINAELDRQAGITEYHSASGNTISHDDYWAAKQFEAQPFYRLGEGLRNLFHDLFSALSHAFSGENTPITETSYADIENTFEDTPIKKLTVHEHYIGFNALLNKNIRGETEHVVFILDGVVSILTPGKVSMHLDANAIIDVATADIGKGGTKKACLFDDKVCLIPNFDVGAFRISQWKKLIRTEKQAADEIARLGIKTQKFTLAELTICDPNTGDSYTIEVLKADSFHTLSKRENITVFDNKNGLSFGNIDYYEGKKDNLNNIELNKNMFQSLLNEIMVALSHGVPCSGDSTNYYIDYNDSHPTFHLFLYDFSNKDGALPKLPIVSTLPVIPSKAVILKKFSSCLSFLAGMITNDELISLGITPSFFSNELYQRLDTLLIKNSHVFDDMYHTALALIQPRTLRDSSMEPLGSMPCYFPSCSTSTTIESAIEDFSQSKPSARKIRGME